MPRVRDLLVVVLRLHAGDSDRADTLTGIVEFDTRASDEVLYGPRDDHVARVRRVHNTGCEVNGDAENISLGPLNLACMQAGADLDAKRDHGFGDRLGAMDRARRTIKQSHKSVAQRFHLVAPEADNFPSNRRIVGLQQFAPRPVSQFTCAHG
jgi:hypothetical protein